MCITLSLSPAAGFRKRVGIQQCYQPFKQHCGDDVHGQFPDQGTIERTKKEHAGNADAPPTPDETEQEYTPSVQSPDASVSNGLRGAVLTTCIGVVSVVVLGEKGGCQFPPGLPQPATAAAPATWTADRSVPTIVVEVPGGHPKETFAGVYEAIGMNTWKLQPPGCNGWLYLDANDYWVLTNIASEVGPTSSKGHIHSIEKADGRPPTEVGLWVANTGLNKAWQSEPIAVRAGNRGYDGDDEDTDEREQLCHVFGTTDPEHRDPAVGDPCPTRHGFDDLTKLAAVSRLHSRIATALGRRGRIATRTDDGDGIDAATHEPILSRLKAHDE